MTTVIKPVIIAVTAVFFLTAALFLIFRYGALPKDDFPETDRLMLIYNKPASKTSEKDTWKRATLPIGNGIIAANIYGEIGNDLLTFNEETLWSGGRCSDNENDTYNGGNPLKSPKEKYDEISDAVLNGKQFDPEELRGEMKGYGAYEPFGVLHTDFEEKSSPVSGYMRSLDLEKGMVSVSYTCDGAKYLREYIASNPRNVIAVHLTCDKPETKLTLSFSSEHTGKALTSLNGKTGKIVFCGKLENGLQLVTETGVCVDDGAEISVSVDKIQISGARDVLICLTGKTDYKNEFYNSDKTVEYYYRSGETESDLTEKVDLLISDALKQGWDKIYGEHERDYTSLYGRVSLSLGQKSGLTTDRLLSGYKKNRLSGCRKKYLEALLFQYGRYLLISSSRENSVLPSNLQGIWNDTRSAPWNSDMHFNINEQMNYWLCGVCNLNECELPLLRYTSSLKIPGGKTVREYTGASHGIMAHTQNTPYGFTAPGWEIATWGWSPAAATWLMQNCYDYFEFTGDTDTLRNTVYPMLKEQVYMYEELLREKDGRLVMPIAQSPEIDLITPGNTYEQSLIAELYLDTIEAAKLLHDDESFIEMMKDTLSKLKPVEIGSSGQVKEWYAETEINSVSDTRKHRHLSNLLGLYPGTLFDTDEKLSAAQVSLLNKQFGHTGTKINPEGGWTYAQLMGSWARVHSGENAYFSLKSMIKNKLYLNLWDFHKFGKYGAFQIDANLGYSAGVGEMLLQSHLGYAELLPALPNEWSNGEFSGLLARNSFEISAKWSDGKINTAEVISRNGGTFSLKSNDGFSVTDSSGNSITAKKNNGIFSFETAKGETYRLNFQ